MTIPIPKLNEEQGPAVDELVKFIGHPTKREILLQGSAGVGKTTCINAVVLHSPKRFVFTAPTNKATKVLAEMVDKYLDGIVPTTTIYKLLGLMLSNTGEVREIVQDAEKAAERLENFDVIVIDEASMINPSLKQHINKALMNHPHLKVIYMGDNYQIPPVKEDKSPVFNLPDKLTLRKVMRHDNQILMLATHVRDCIDQLRVPDFISNNDEKGGVFCVKRNRFFELIAECYGREAYQTKPNYAKAMAWRNEAVQNINDYVRNVLYQDKAGESGFHVGEKIVACMPICDIAEKKSGVFVPLMSTDEEGIVQQVKIVDHPVYRDIKCYELAIQPEFGDDWILAYTPHEDSKPHAEALLNRLADAAKAKRGSWSSFWDAKDMLHDIRPCHAITTHRSQGSTYEIAFVNTIDILSNRNREEALKCLYVAVSRPSRVLVINK